MNLPNAAAVLVRLRAELPTIRRWGTRGFWAVTDQALFAGTNFAVNILLARWLEPEEYGAFALAHAAFLLLAPVHVMLVTEPFAYYKASGRVVDPAQYYRCVILLGNITSIAVAACLVFGGLTLALSGWSQNISAALFGSGIAAPLLLRFLLERRAAYVELSSAKSARASACYSIGALVCLIGLWISASLNAFLGFLALAAGACAGILCFRQKKIVEKPCGRATFCQVRRLHWQYGSWLYWAALANWLTQSLWQPVLAFQHGVTVAAEFRVLMLLVAPYSHFNAAMGQFLVPVMARREVRLTRCRAAFTAGALLLVPAVTYSCMIWLAGSDTLLAAVGGQYEMAVAHASWLTLVPVLMTAQSVTVAYFAAAGLSDRVWWTHLSAGLVAVLMGIPLIRLFGLKGALIAYNLSIAVALVVAWLSDVAAYTIQRRHT